VSESDGYGHSGVEGGRVVCVLGVWPCSAEIKNVSLC
jgi:hypothetical protein